MKPRVLVLVLLVCVSLSALAQTPSSAQHAKVRKLLELTGAGKLGMQVIDGMMATWRQAIPDVPKEFWDSFRAKVKPDDLVNMLAPVYEKHISEADLDTLIAFFDSPAGRRYIEKQPFIVADSMKVGQEWGERLAQEVIAELTAKGYAPKK